ncbi:MAG: prepilin-type N-terminal cleavage/methylation domain-containing protein, partial [Oscillospiraceae bacterium]|nr:prepilin-type N-terminal cleavage/methylation domain-containing protein [Oscillospiraceae bacterium]
MMKRIKRLLLCRKNGGFTLAEMIISCALLGILMLGIVMFV